MSSVGDVKPSRLATPEERLRFHGWQVTPAGCWEWLGNIGTQGYGHLMIGRKQFRAHRVAYEVWVGPIPEGMVVRHKKCDNHICINPKHLRVGTQADNMDDKMSQGRHVGGGQRLTPDDVRHIRQGYDSGLITHGMSAELYGISSEMAYKIATRKSWRNIE